MDLKNYFEISTGLYAVQISTYSESFAHTNYCITSNLAENYIMSVPLANANIKELFNQEYEFIKLAKKEKYDDDTVFYDRDRGAKIYKQKGSPTSQQDLVDNYMLFIKSLKALHGLDTSKSKIQEFSPLDLYNYIRERVDKININKDIEDYLITKTKEVYNKCSKKALCHNNLSLQNIVKHTTKYSFVSTQLISISDPLYDLANFFFKNNITNKIVIEKFLKRYFGNEYNDTIYENLKIYLAFAKLIYAVWNEYLYIISDALYKRQRADKLFSQLNDIKIKHGE